MDQQQPNQRGCYQQPYPRTAEQAGRHVEGREVMKSWELFINKTNKSEFETQLSKILEDVLSEQEETLRGDCN